MVSRVHENVPLHHVQPGLIFLIDDSTMFVFAGTACDSKWVLYDKNRASDSTKSVFTGDPGGTDHLNGIRARLTHASNGLGQLAPLYITFYGLSERELPSKFCKSGMLQVKVPGLCYAGNIDVRSDQVGYINFIRATKTADSIISPSELNFSIYRRDILPNETVDIIRNKTYGWQPGTEIPNELKAVLWCDGAISQLSCVCDDNQQQIEAARKIASNKHNASRTGDEQSLDLCPLFRSLNKIQNTITTKDIHITHNSLKKMIEGTLKKLEEAGELNLTSKNKKAIVDFLTCIPGVLAKAAPTPCTMLKGFRVNGMLDENTGCYPDFNKMIGTLRRKVTKEELDLCEKHFPTLYKQQIYEGHIPESLFDELGFPQDVNMEGLLVERNASINQEHCQRSKSLSHPFQRGLRVKRLQELEEERTRKFNLANSKLDKLLEENEECEKKVLLYGNHSSLEECSLENMAKCKAGLLEAFIKVRKYPSLSKKSNLEFTMPKNKGKLVEAQAGVHNLIKLAHDIWTEKVVMVSSDKNDSSLEENPSQPQPVIINLQSQNQPSSSVFICDIFWKQKLQESLINSSSNFPNIDQLDKYCELAEHLHKILLGRLRQHIRTKIKDVTKHTHWSLQFMNDNLSRLSAISVLFGHVIQDLRCADSNTQLLVHPDISGPYPDVEDMIFNDAEGAYLYYDSVNKYFVWSGKVVGKTRNFKVQGDEHLKSSMNAAV